MLSEQLNTMSPEQIRFCFAIAMGDEEKAADLLPQIYFLSPVEKENLKQGFRYCPSIFALWAAKQSEGHSVYQLLAKTFPHEAAQQKHDDGMTPSSETIRNLVKKLVLEPLKRNLHPFLMNIAQLHGNNNSELERFYLTTSFAALALLCKKNSYFSDAQLPVAKNLRDKLRHECLLAQFDDLLSGGLERIQDVKETPQTVKTLIASFRPQMAWSANHTYLPPLMHSMHSREEDDFRHLPKMLLVN